jgi:hypothetical protein
VGARQQQHRRRRERRRQGGHRLSLTKAATTLEQAYELGGTLAALLME